MARIDKEKFWHLLGTFYDIFTPEQKKSWEALWESYTDISSDLWHLAFQTDREKSLFSSEYATKRLNTRILLSNRRDAKFIEMGLARAAISNQGRYQITGALPEGGRVLSSLIPSKGLLWLGEEVLDYDSAALDLREDNSVRKVVFTLATAPRRPIHNETTFGDTFPETALRTTLWGVTGVAPTVNNSLIIAHPIPGPSTTTLSHTPRIRNGDFEVELTFELQNSGTPAAGGSRILGLSFISGATTATIRYNDNPLQIEAGLLAALSDIGLPPELVPDVPTSNESPIPIRFFASREERTLILSVIFSTSSDAVVVQRLEDFGSGPVSVRIDASNDSDLASRFIVRDLLLRFGETQTSLRAHPTFFSSPTHPFVFSIDQNIVAAKDLRDEPIFRNKEVFVNPAPNVGATFLQASGISETLVAGSLPSSGFIVLHGQKILYDKIILEGGIARLQLRRPLDAYDLVGISGPFSTTVYTRNYEENEFSLGISTLSFREPPAAGAVWALSARIDTGSLQDRYGKLVGLTSSRSDVFYLNKVKASWAAKMRGPTLSNIESAVAAFAGLPIARLSGRITEISVERDSLGRIIKSTCLINAVPHDLDPNLIPRINWIVRVGQKVEMLQPLTNGFTVLDFIKDPDWMRAFGIPTDTAEKFNTFGVSVDSEALSRHSSIFSLYDFLTKNRFLPKKLLFQIGILDDVSLDPDIEFACEDIPLDCLDLTFPEEPAAYERFGAGEITALDPAFIATFEVLDPALHPRARFLNTDLGRDIIIREGLVLDGFGIPRNNGRFRIREVLSPSRIRFWNPRGALEAGLAWQAGEEPSPTLGRPLGRGGAFLGHIATLGRSGVWHILQLDPGVVLGQDFQQGPVALDLVTDNEVHSRQGTGTITGVVAGTATFTVVAGVPNQRFVVTDIGKDIAITTVGANQGFFRITGFTNATTITFLNVGAVAIGGLDFIILDPPRGWQQIIELFNYPSGPAPQLAEKRRRVRFQAEDFLDEYRAIGAADVLDPLFAGLDALILDDGSTIYMGFIYLGATLEATNNITVTATRRGGARILGEAWASPCSPKLTHQPSELVLAEELISIDIGV